MFEKHSEEFSGFGTCGPRGIGPANTSFGKGPQDGINGKVIKLEVFFRRSFPILNVGFIPEFPQPGFHLGISVTLAEMMNELEDKLRPLPEVLRWIGPAGINGAPRKIVAIGFGVSGQSLRHEADFDQGLDVMRPKGIENAVESRPTVDRLAGSVFGIHIRRTPLQGCRAVTTG